MSERWLVEIRSAPIVSVRACSGKILGFSAGVSSQSLYQNAAASAGVRLAGCVLEIVSTALRLAVCCATTRCTLNRDRAAPRRSF